MGEYKLNFNNYVEILKRKIKLEEKKKILFVCIGTNDILWDSIGPNVGSYLKSKIGEEKVLGDIKHNICMRKDLFFYYPKIRNNYIIAIDTALTNAKINGKIFISNKPIIMGSALGYNKGKIGNVSIKVGIGDIEKITKKDVDNISNFVGDGIVELIR